MIGFAVTPRSLAALVGALVITLGWCGHASAGTYVMRSCNVPGSAPAPAAPWQWEYALHTVGFDDCAAGGGFGFQLPNTRMMTRVSTASLRIARPATGPKSVIRIRRVRLWLVARLAGSGSSLFVVTTTATSAGASTQTDVFGNPGGNTLNAPYASPFLPQDLTKFRVVLACSGSSPNHCFPANARPLEIRGAEVTLEEDVPPVVEVGGGTLSPAVRQAGVRTVSFVARDDASGIVRVEALLGDTVAGAKSVANSCRYSDFNACPAGLSDDITVNTRLVSNGDYRFRLRVTDAAGNRRTVQLPGVVTVYNGAASSSTRYKLAASLVGTAKKGRVRYGRRASVRGRLTRLAGGGVPNARIEVTERRLLGAKTMRTALITTGSDGKFSYRVLTKGPSRSIRFRLKWPPEASADAATRTVRLRVGAGATFRVGLKGIRVRYRGRVVSRPIPRRGKIVLIQGRVPGGRWQTFASRRTDRHGRFAGRYRLRVYRPGVRLQFRAFVPLESGYPYVGSASRALTRQVR